MLTAESKVKLSSLPAAVQTTVKNQTKTAKLVGISKEIEGGQTLYEVETLIDGKSRDLIVNKAGAVIEVEEQVAIDTIPAAARAGIEQKTAGGKIKKVELLTKGSEKSYEVSYVTKSGKNAEYGINADGSAHK